MPKITYEDMMDQVDLVLIARLGPEASGRRHPKAEQKLIEWFAINGIELEIKGWENHVNLWD